MKLKAFCELRSLLQREKRLVFVFLMLAIVLAAAGVAACGGSGTLNSPHRNELQLKTPLVTPAPSAAVFTTIQLPSANTYLGGITTGPDSNLWLTECDPDKIARVTTDGTITEFQVPTPNACPASIISGPDGAVWFVENAAIGRITTAGVITEFPVPAPPLAGSASGPSGLAFGPDGNLWFDYASPIASCGEGTASDIMVMSTAGSILATYATPTADSGPALIIAGPDGNMWFGEDNANKMGRITMSGVITEFPIPTPPELPNTCEGGSAVGGVTAGPDGNVWFSERSTPQIGRITPSGIITEFGPYLTGGYIFLRIVTGPDGNLWFVEKPAGPPPAGGLAAYIGRMTPAGDLFAEYSWGTGGPRALTVGPDNAIWYTDEFNDVVGRLTSGIGEASIKRHH